MTKILLNLPLLLAFAACSRSPDPIISQRLDKLEQQVQHLDKEVVTLSNRFEGSNRSMNLDSAAIGDDEDQMKALKSLSNAKRIALGCVLFAGEHEGSLPRDLNELIPKYLPDKKLLSSPLAPTLGQVDYEYFGAGDKWDEELGSKVLLRDRYTTINGKRNVVHFDMSSDAETP